MRYLLGLAAGTQQLEILHVMGLVAGLGRNMGRSLDLGLDATIKGMISHDHVNYGGRNSVETLIQISIETALGTSIGASIANLLKRCRDIYRFTDSLDFALTIDDRWFSSLAARTDIHRCSSLREHRSTLPFWDKTILCFRACIPFAFLR